MMERREVADRVGRACVAGQREGLAAAAAEIEFAPLAALARLGQVISAPKRVEAGVVFPDVAQRTVSDRPTFTTIAFDDSSLRWLEINT
jgi:hypothetical protein